MFFLFFLNVSIEFYSKWSELLIQLNRKVMDFNWKQYRIDGLITVLQGI